jgi:hypothetical protein
MVSLSTIPKRKTYPAVVPWFLDSGGFTEIQNHGRWRTTAAEHAARCADIVDRFGNVSHVSPQDWMCEPPMITRTGLSVAEHQRRTVDNYVELMAIAPEIPWVPVLQGWHVADYHHCADLYAAAGVQLANARLVGVGSVCRRQAMGEAVEIMRTLASRDFKLHGFGFKQEGIAKCWPYLASADSMAWSYNARAEYRSCGRPNGRGGVVASCANCRHYALDWYERTIARIGEPIQLELVAA